MKADFFKRRRSPSSASPADTVVDNSTMSTVDVEKVPVPVTRGRTISREHAHKRDPFLVSFEHIDSQDPRKFTQGRKWLIILLALAVQFWANALSSMVAPAVAQISSDLHVSTAAGRVIQAIFLYGVAVGAVVLTPLSEGEFPTCLKVWDIMAHPAVPFSITDYGRLPTHITFVALMGIFQIPCAFAPNYATLVCFRFLAGFCCAVTFNSVGMISDMWDPDFQSWPVNAFALSAEAGAALGTIMGGYIFVGTGNWRWIFGVGGIGTALLLAIFIAYVPETRAGVILSRRASKLRKETGEKRYHSHHEILLQKRTIYAIVQESLLRPIYMLFREPIVLWFALFDGFNYAIVYLALESIPLIYMQWGFSTGALNLPFLAILTGEMIAYCLYYFQLKLEARDLHKNNGVLTPESRLYWMLLGGVVFPTSLFWFAWTTQGPPLPWIVSILALGLFGISSHIIFISVSDYTIASYSIYSSSAVGAQSLLREILSGSVTLFATPLYKNLGFQWASSLLGFIAIIMAIVPPILYFFGPRIRAASAFALQIKEAEREAKLDAAHAKDEYDRSRSQSRAGTDRETIRDQVHQAQAGVVPTDLAAQDAVPSSQV